MTLPDIDRPPDHRWPTENHRSPAGLENPGSPWTDGTPIAQLRLAVLTVPSVAAAGIAVWNPAPLALHIFALLSVPPLLYFYLASRSRQWDIVQVFSIVTVIFVPVSVSLGLLFGYFEASPGLAMAQAALTLIGLSILLVLNTIGRGATEPITISDRVDHLPVLTLVTLAITLNFVVPVPVLGDRTLFAAAVFCAAVGAGSHSLFRGMRVHYVVLSLVLAVVYYQTVFTGFGRLLIASLGFAIVLALVGLRSSAAVRAGCVGAMIPLLMVASFIETTRSAESSEVSLGVAGFADGLGSVFGPIGTFGDVIDRDAAEGRGIAFMPDRDTTRGATIAAAAVSPIPRFVWPDKPRGIGRVGVENLYPHLRASPDHTFAFMMVGEFYFEFGLVGVAVGGILILFALRSVELRRIQFVSAGNQWTRERLAAYALLLAGIPDLVWGGLFGFASRSLLRLLVLLFVVLVTNLFTRRFGEVRAMSPIGERGS